MLDTHIPNVVVYNLISDFGIEIEEIDLYHIIKIFEKAGFSIKFCRKIRQIAFKDAKKVAEIVSTLKDFRDFCSLSNEKCNLLSLIRRYLFIRHHLKLFIQLITKFIRWGDIKFDELVTSADFLDAYSRGRMVPLKISLNKKRVGNEGWKTSSKISLRIFASGLLALYVESDLNASAMINEDRIKKIKNDALSILENIKKEIHRLVYPKLPSFIHYYSKAYIVIVREASNIDEILTRDWKTLVEMDDIKIFFSDKSKNLLFAIKEHKKILVEKLLYLIQLINIQDYFLRTRGLLVDKFIRETNISFSLKKLENCLIKIIKLKKDLSFLTEEINSSKIISSYKMKNFHFAIVNNYNLYNKADSIKNKISDILNTFNAIYSLRREKRMLYLTYISVFLTILLVVDLIVRFII